MAEIITMPRLSDTMEEGTVATWLKKVGDAVSEGDILAEIETDKATMEFESFHEGTLLHIGIQEGEAAKVDSLLAIIGKEGEDISALLSQGPKVAAEKIEEVVEVTDASKSADIPDGVVVVTMPRLSDTMEEGTVATWLKKPGDSVNEGDILAEIETDKATMEFESFNEGTLLHIGIQEGESAKVDALLAIIGPKGTDISGLAKNFTHGTASAKPVEDTKVTIEKASAPVVKEVEVPQVASPTVNSSDRIFVSPLAKKMAEDKGIHLSQIRGSGEHGRIIKRDIENFVPSGVGVQSNVPFVPAGTEQSESTTNSPMRKAIAKRLSQSKFSAPHYYLNVEFDMNNAVAFRTQFNTLPNTKISFNDMVIKAVALSLKQCPQVNGQWFEDKIQQNHHVHVGVAVAVEDGLIVPVLRFANEQSMQQINVAVKDYAQRAQQKKLSQQEIEGSTFTVSNLGMFGIESFTSIINQPNVAILSVGAIVQKPVVKNGAVVPGHVMKLTMACDHRVVDGATGAKFLQTLRGYVENPVTMLA